VVLFDKLANRWLLEQLEYSTSYQICVAVSQTDDATGATTLLVHLQRLTRLPKLAIWRMRITLPLTTSARADGEPCAMDRTAMIAGKTAAMICFNPNSSDMGFLPSDVDGSTPPPSGAPNITWSWETLTPRLRSTTSHVDFTVPRLYLQGAAHH